MTSLAAAMEHDESLKNAVPINLDRGSRYALYYEILSRHCTLAPHHRERLIRLQQSPRRVAKDDTIIGHGQSTKTLYAVQQGWACSRRVSRDGHGQIIDLYLPGDIVGLRDYQGGRFDEVTMLTDGLLIPVQKPHLEQVTRQNPDLAEALLAVALHQGNIITDRLNNLLGHDAITRLAHFLMELNARLNTFGPDSDRLALPISQQVIGDLLGMTNVHVCRCMSSLQTQRLLRRNAEPRSIQLLNRTALIELSGFAMSYLFTCMRRGQNWRRGATS
ncbi:Crp/Fnr family transcriptional regulator [Salinicola rhizosphaerae]|uniref:Crp/Fnr family transcriptional regulator n=1 Tax=Salinicola rhizosphaerae TaxID=1443141 RepID=A0ABQ3ED53_9GAMM|nr:Crp/Fnr family transcriptional regulator [Salinicola rhizosphaerae]GHB34187.1 Crp/Fnr family transcriptional regulator [Salinicola rhizosphaerae]